MLAKDISELNDIDTQIKDVIEQLNELLELRTTITSDVAKPKRKSTRVKYLKNVDFSSIDLAVRPTNGLSIN